MSNYLLELGISEEEIKRILEINNGLTDYNEYEKNIETLRILGCSENSIKNIVISNPNVLIRSNSDIIKLVNYLKTLRLESLNIVFDTNPYLLNKDDFEVEEFFNKYRKHGLSDEKIIDIFEDKFYDID